MATYTKMSSSTPTCSTGTYASGKKYREFKNLANINNTSSSYTMTNGKIGGKSTTWNKPSIITLKNFNFNLILLTFSINNTLIPISDNFFAITLS